MFTKTDLDQLGKVIDEKLKPVKEGQAKTNETVGQIKTLVDAIAAGQAEIKETMATKADVSDLKATVMKKVNDHETRIADLEKEAGIPHPHKH
jgi:ABC-type transporter Mla subunit MlaD